ncbi:hypothetical protein TW95_gp0157 [Pandoravirus inopinatum]|uniref:Uncharacterized protein n=1 Tax=Pandoravirus inopinatum TaxID=1605721 RepID=A0A0B5J7Y2_9VIRU|nr:hypothetical protein TW95_gp0157 [Pandoravirus inopinatum]AJF96891.1 hypothetical protein [Pandoravirus inopinatum]
MPRKRHLLLGSIFLSGELGQADRASTGEKKATCWPSRPSVDRTRSIYPSTPACIGRDDAGHVGRHRVDLGRVAAAAAVAAVACARPRRGNVGRAPRAKGAHDRTTRRPLLCRPRQQEW